MNLRGRRALFDDVRLRRASVPLALLAVLAAVAATAPAGAAGTSLGPIIRIRTPGESRCPGESEPDVVVTRAGTWVAYNDMHQCWTPVGNEMTSAISVQLVPAGGGAPRHLRVEPHTPESFLNGDPALSPDPHGDGVLLTSLYYSGWYGRDSTTVQAYRISPSLRVTRLPGPALHPAGIEAADKPFNAADTNPRSPYFGRFYAVWDDGVAGALAFRAFDGRRWGVWSFLARPGGHPDVAVSPKGHVAVAWETYDGVRVRVSTDGGATWGPARLVIAGHQPGRRDPSCLYATVGPRQRATKSVRAVYDSAGRLHVVAAIGGVSWNPDVIPPPVGVGAGGTSVVTHAWSADGSTWRASTLHSEGDAVRFHPAVARTPAGGVAVAWLEVTSPTEFEAYVAVAAPGRTTFGSPIRVSARPAAFVLASESMLTTGCYGIGDYIGLATSPRGVVVAWPTTEGGTPSLYDTDVLVREVRLR